MKRKKKPNTPPRLPAKRAAKPVLCEGCLVVGIGSCQTWAGKPSRCSLRRGGKGSSAPGLGPRCSTVPVPHRCGDGGFPPKPVPRGHRAYLSSAPHYDFPRYRQLVHEITLAFNGISREVLCIAGRLRDEFARPDLAQHLARLQEREQEKLQLVSTGLGGGVPPLPGAGLGLLFGGVSAPAVSPPQTAQLQLARQQAQDQPDVDAHQQEVRELKHK